MAVFYGYLEDMIKIEVIPGENSSLKDLNHDWRVVSRSEKSLIIKINFILPQAVRGSDQVAVNLKGLGEILMVKKEALVKQYRTKLVKLKTADGEAVEDAAKAIGAAQTAVVVASAAI